MHFLFGFPQLHSSTPSYLCICWCSIYSWNSDYLVISAYYPAEYCYSFFVSPSFPKFFGLFPVDLKNYLFVISSPLFLLSNFAGYPWSKPDFDIAGWIQFKEVESICCLFFNILFVNRFPMILSVESPYSLFAGYLSVICQITCFGLTVSRLLLIVSFGGWVRGFVLLVDLSPKLLWTFLWISCSRTSFWVSHHAWSAVVIGFSSWSKLEHPE